MQSINESINGYRLNYKTTHRKLQDAIASIRDEGGELTVRNVAKRAGVCAATAYNHKCQELIQEEMLKK